MQVLHGRITDNDNLVATTAESLALAETYEGGRYRFEGRVSLQRTGPIGYTVRIVPQHPALTSVAELGRIALPHVTH